MLGIYRVAAQVVAFRAVLSSTELVSLLEVSIGGRQVSSTAERPVLQCSYVVDTEVRRRESFSAAAVSIIIIQLFFCSVQGTLTLRFEIEHRYCHNIVEAIRCFL
jgi:hypothetical protein